MEEWRDVVGYEGLYQVSSEGRIKSLHYFGGNRQVIMSQNTRKDGYKCVGLSKNGIAKTNMVHRIVAEAFIENPDNLEMVNHKDEDKGNNRVENLEWCTRSYNQLYSMKLHEERKYIFGNNFIKNGENTSPYTKKGIAHTKTRAVIQKDLDGNFIARYKNAAEATFLLGFKNSGSIGTVCDINEKPRVYQRNRKRTKRSAYGYIWEYE